MTVTSFRLDIGEFRCRVISDGTIEVPPISPDTGRGELMDVNCLLIESGRQKILIDTGCGGGYQTSAGKLVQNLRREGIEPAQIDTIIYTHGHGDHVGGSFDSTGRRVFTHARQIVSRLEWESWENMTETDPNFHIFEPVRKKLLSCPENFDLVEEGSEVIPGIRLLPAHGHTPGSIMLEIASGGDRLLCIGDMIHGQMEFEHPEYYTFMDSSPEMAGKTRDEVLARIAESGVLVFANHFAFPGIGRFVKKGRTLGWQPVGS
jgi:glyoxylase-like metal-dependent hydrolase (beta-lactamase superfamily II)